MASLAYPDEDSNPFAIAVVGLWDVLSKVPDSIFEPLLPEGESRLDATYSTND
jgi:hypothetical protein